MSKNKSFINAFRENTIAKKYDVGRIRTYAPEGTRFLVLRDNHSATTPMVDAVKQLLMKFDSNVHYIS
jgi:hypothetical protein